MLKISWYWWVAGAVGILLFVGANTDSGSSIDISPTATSVSEYPYTVSPEVDNDALKAEEDSTTPASNIKTDQEGSVAFVPSASSSLLYQVVRVVDGDTIEVMYEGVKRSVRYIGIDTPETVHPSKPVECMGKEASDYNKSLVAGKMVALQRDISDTDKYGRLLRYVYVDDVMVNEVLIKEGYANVLTYPPDVKYNDHFRTLEQEARSAKKGLWSEVCANDATVGTPTAPNPTAPVNPSGASCRIKGNISASQEKIFHVPGCQFYEKTVITEAAGERWFCSEQEALAAGWRKALNCNY